MSKQSNPYIKNVPDWLKKENWVKRNQKKGWKRFFSKKQDFGDEEQIQTQTDNINSKENQPTTAKKNPVINKSFVPLDEKKIENSTEREPHKNTAEQKKELRLLEEEILQYFYTNNQDLKEYYTNREIKNKEYQAAIVRPQSTYFKLVTSHYNYRNIQIKLRKYGIQFRIAYPLNGEIGFVTATNDTTKEHQKTKS